MVLLKNIKIIHKGENKMKKKNVLKVLCAGALVCLSPLMFAGCMGSGDVDALKNKIAQLEEKITQLESLTPEAPETPVLNITSKEDAYNFAKAACDKVFLSNNGVRENIKLSLLMDGSNEGIYQIGQLSDGSEYMYEVLYSDEGDLIREDLYYTNNNNMYRFYTYKDSFNYITTHEAIAGTSLNNLEKLQSLNFLNESVIDSMNMSVSVENYKLLENRNIQITILLEDSHNDEINKVLYNYEINSKLEIVSLKGVYSNTTGEGSLSETDLTNVECKIDYNNIVSDETLLRIKTIKDLDLTTN